MDLPLSRWAVVPIARTACRYTCSDSVAALVLHFIMARVLSGLKHLPACVFDPPPLPPLLETLETFNLGACMVGIHAGSDASMDLVNDLVTVPLNLHDCYKHP
jgi:hypothetical protein